VCVEGIVLLTPLASAVTRLRWRFFKIMLIALLIIGALVAFAMAIDDARIEREAAQINGAWIRSRQR
jgi:hypothetical protein